MEQQTKDEQSPTASRAKHHQSTTILDANYSIVITSSILNTKKFILMNYKRAQESINHVRSLTRNRTHLSFRSHILVIPCNS